MELFPRNEDEDGEDDGEGDVERDNDEPESDLGRREDL